MKRACCATVLILAAAAVSVQAAQGDDRLDAVLDKASAYVANYIKALSSVVSEERYEQVVQRLVSRGSGMPSERQSQTRVLVSDYLLVQPPGSTEWVPFRDVYSVDGRLIHDRTDRLVRMFLDPQPASWSRALQIREESSRFNIGDVTRDINVPTLALTVLHADMRRSFSFRDKGRDRIDGVQTVVVEYAENATPTMILGRNDENVPATGRLWIDPESGAVVRTQFDTKPSGMTTRIVVSYSRDPSLQILVPREMREEHQLIEQKVTGRATYSNFRRFKVDTSFEVK